MNKEELRTHLAAFFWGKYIPTDVEKLADLILEALGDRILSDS